MSRSRLSDCHRTGSVRRCESFGQRTVQLHYSKEPIMIFRLSAIDGLPCRRSKTRIETEFMNFMNQNNEIVTQDLTKGFVDHGSIGLGSQAVTKFALHHAEGRFDV